VPDLVRDVKESCSRIPNRFQSEYLLLSYVVWNGSIEDLHCAGSWGSGKSQVARRSMSLLTTVSYMFLLVDSVLCANVSAIMLSGAFGISRQNFIPLDPQIRTFLADT
jgi:hypothetical protein